MLRSLRLGEADRILHVYTLDRGRIGAVAKGLRRTKSRFGARLEPLSHVELMLHQGSGELHTVTGVELIRPHSASREDPYRLGVGLVGLEAMLRLFSEQEANPRAFEAITRFLDLLDDAPSLGRPASRSTRSRSPSSSSCCGSRATCRTSAAAPSAGPSSRPAASHRRRAAPSAATALGDRRARALARRHRRHRRAPPPAARRGARSRALGAGPARRAHGGDLAVRVPRRFPPAHAVGMTRRRSQTATSSTTTRTASTWPRCTASSRSRRSGAGSSTPPTCTASTRSSASARLARGCSSGSVQASRRVARRGTRAPADSARRCRRGGRRTARSGCLLGDAGVGERAPEGGCAEVEVVLVAAAGVDPDRPHRPQRPGRLRYAAHRVPGEPPLPDLRHERARLEVEGEVDRAVLVRRVAGGHRVDVQQHVVARLRQRRPAGAEVVQNRSHEPA